MRCWCVTLLAVLVMGSSAWGDPFSVDGCRLYIEAHGGTTSMGPSDEIDEVQNPFVDSHFVVFEATCTEAFYDFAWDETGGRFDGESSLQTEVKSWMYCHSYNAGHLYITPAVDLQFHVEGRMDFDVPVPGMHSAMYLDAWSDTEHALDVVRSYESSEGGLGSGTLAYEGDFILSAGRTWTMGYSLWLQSLVREDVEPGTVATAHGDVSFTFQVVPEPSSVGLVLMGSLAVLNRRRRSSGRIRG